MMISFAGALPQNSSYALLAIEVDDGSQRTFARRFTDFSTPCATATPTRRSSWHRRSGVRSSKRNPDPAGSGAAVSSPSTATRPTSPSERSLSWIRDYVRDAVARRAERGDANLHYVDGLDLFSLADAADLPDDLHPNGDGYERIGQRWHALAG